MAKRPKQLEDTQPKGDPAGGGNSMEQIRELLFGATQRDNESRAQLLETRLEKHSREAADRLDAARTALEARIAKATADLKAGLAKLGGDLEAAETTASRDNAELEDVLSSRIADLEQSLRDEIKALAKDTQNRFASLETELESTTARLDDEKTDRRDLGDYLIEFGMRLKGDSALEALRASVKEALGEERGNDT